jgi:uncharacterized membrane protein YedE/YeeE
MPTAITYTSVPPASRTASRIFLRLRRPVSGIVFGMGFGLLAYCPGTNAAAVGQGNLDALLGVAGMVAGAYLYALCSGFISRSIGRWGRRGKITLADLFGLRRGIAIAIAAPLLVLVLLLIEFLGA